MRLGGAEKRRACGRARSAHAPSDSPRLSERSERSERSEFGDGAARPSIAGQSARSADRSSEAAQTDRTRLCRSRPGTARDLLRVKLRAWWVATARWLDGQTDPRHPGPSGPRAGPLRPCARRRLRARRHGGRPRGRASRRGRARLPAAAQPAANGITARAAGAGAGAGRDPARRAPGLLLSALARRHAGAAEGLSRAGRAARASRSAA